MRYYLVIFVSTAINEAMLCERHADLVQQIRDLINEPWKQHIFLKNRLYWNQLCSFLDAIEDSELGISASGIANFKVHEGMPYLAIHGLMQALLVQKDAVFNLCESLTIEETLDTYPMLGEIRKIRNESVGHPTKKTGPKGKSKSFHHISRHTLKPSGFQLLTNYGNGNHEFKDISMQELINEQKKYLSEILGKIIKSLESEWVVHKEKFRMEKLVDCFPQTLGYPIQKLYERIRQPVTCQGSHN